MVLASPNESGTVSVCSACMCSTLRLLDDHIYARTGWSKAPNSNSTPYWGEQFGFTEAPSFSTCSEYAVTGVCG